MLKGKKILLGVCGGIAAYKSAVLTRLLIKEGAAVQVIMTPAAHDFITPLTLATLSKRAVLTTFSKPETGEWNNHVALGIWADVMIVAPATANTLAQMAHGQCDNLLLAIYLSARCPVILAPAMDVDMLQHPSTKDNLERLLSHGNHIINSSFGELASGLTGQGRMAEPEEIVEKLTRLLHGSQPLHGTRALVTAGPTYEAIDPVRFIGNHSSGKMGYAIAEALAARGAHVELVSGRTHLQAVHPLITVTPVTSAAEMYDACIARFDNTDISVLAAAVADYRPATQATEKIKKKDGNLTLELTATRDIAAELGKRKRKGQLVVGFALEMNDAQANALKKLEAKNFDLIVLNSLQDKGAGFGYDTNKVTIFDRRGRTVSPPLKDKQAVADDIVEAIMDYAHVNTTVSNVPE